MRLLGRTGQLTGRTVAVTGAMRIGRAPDNEIQISADGVSRLHAKLVPDGDGVVIEDLHSANGTFLNGVRIVRERLAHLDVISLGLLAELIVDARTSAPLTSPATGEAFLETLDGPTDGERVVVPAGELTIGRVPPSNLLIESRIVSKLHARLRRTPDRLAIDDLDSPNGTFVNGARITTNHPLVDGDTISIAGLRSFRVHLAGAAAAPATSVAAPATVVASPAAPALATVIATPDLEPPAFSQEWKTKLVWSADELSALEKERERIVDEVRRSTGGLPGSGATRLATIAAAVAAPPVLEPAPPPAPAAASASSTPPPLPATSAFRPGADLPPAFAEAPPPEPVAAPALPAAAEAAASTGGELRLEGPAGTFTLTPGEHVVGRQEGVSIYVQDRQVSRAHAVITVSAGGVSIEDKASANGTYVNNERLSAVRTLKAGDEVRFGDVRFSVVART